MSDANTNANYSGAGNDTEGYRKLEKRITNVKMRLKDGEIFEAAKYTGEKIAARWGYTRIYKKHYFFVRR